MKPVFLICVCLVLPVAARAQVIVNPAALLQLAGIAPPSLAPPPSPPPAIRHFSRRVARRTAPPQLLVAVAKAPPPAALPVVARPAPLPPAKPAPLPPVAIDFAAGSAALPAGAAAALKNICHATGFVSIDATAPGDPSDPSVAMRLSLSRAFAVRDALTACGLPAAQILPRALGDVPGRNENIAQVSGPK